MITSAKWYNSYRSWTLGELVDVYEIIRNTFECDGDIKEIRMGKEDE